MRFDALNVEFWLRHCRTLTKLNTNISKVMFRKLISSVQSVLDLECFKLWPRLVISKVPPTFTANRYI